MVYLAHCSFDERGVRPSFGHFTYLVKADSLEDARERLREAIVRARDRTDLFDSPVDIFLDDIVEVSRLPRRGVICRYQNSPGHPPPRIFCTLPASDPLGVVGHHNGVEDEGENGADDLGVETAAVEPFMTFGPKGG